MKESNSEIDDQRIGKLDNWGRRFRIGASGLQVVESNSEIIEASESNFHIQVGRIMQSHANR